jgi:hypothetical protein
MQVLLLAVLRALPIAGRRIAISTETTARTVSNSINVNPAQVARLVSRAVRSGRHGVLWIGEEFMSSNPAFVRPTRNLSNISKNSSPIE